ncbi:MAG TPA: YhjD/YihY/BrkB family envelope integrity protein, partial [Intrasporangium sp.]|uniref:YihY/virulence factor BrkB family protein n=1 Tax=Intrasporangium sp. TaxID=1925024 RepID=UPI002D79071A
MTERLDAFQRRRHWAGFPIAVVYKFVDDQGTYLAALVAHYGFLSLFPLLLLLTSVLGFALQGNPDLQHQILTSTLSQFPVIGDQLRTTGLTGSGTGLVIGLLGSVYGGLGVAQAVQHVMNVAWGVPVHRRPNPLLARARSLLLLGTAGLAVAATTVLSALGASADAFGATTVGAGLTVLLTLASVVVNAGVFLLAFHIATARDLRWRDSVPGALLAALAWQLLQWFGAFLVGHELKNATVLGGVFGLVLGLLAWLFVAGTAIVLAVEVNVVLTKRLWPRALLTPFTDDVDLTRGDRRIYSDAARAQQAKGFENVDVTFDNDGQNASRSRGLSGSRPGDA